MPATRLHRLVHAGLRGPVLQPALFALILVASIVSVAAVAVALLPVIVLLAVAVLPWLVPLVLACAYAVSTLAYLMYAQHEQPALLLRWHPRRVLRVFWAVKLAVFGTLVDPITHQLVRFAGAKLWNRRVQGSIVENVEFDARTGMKLDVFLAKPADHSHKAKNGMRLSDLRPVAVFIYGGGWNSGSKAYYQPLGHQLARRGIVTVIPDYRIYPTGSVDDMLHDVAACLLWVRQHIERYGGDPDRISLVGHSAGAHLALLTQIAGAVTESSLERPLDPLEVLTQSGFYAPSASPTRSPSSRALASSASRARSHPPMLPTLDVTLPSIRACILLSGVFNIEQHHDFESGRGVEELSGMRRACGHTLENMLLRSPTVLLSAAMCAEDQPTPLVRALETVLPRRIVVVHGSHDAVVPCSQATAVAELLRVLNPDVQLAVRDRMAHSEPVALLMQRGTAFQHEVAELIKSAGADAGLSSGGAGSVSPARLGSGRATGRVGDGEYAGALL
ncbi:hypothetical protein H9P43_002822 [Blastocladiella emersonii ATCC 22665]|nr:hypothetical protein H9P43_002822 [Blastocladiella emersonii ATCC 22665]